MSGSVRDSGCNSPSRLGRVTETMVESLTLVRSTPIMLGATERLSTGAPEEIRTPDPQIRSLGLMLDSTDEFCKRCHFRSQEINGLHHIAKCKPKRC